MGKQELKGKWRTLKAKLTENVWRFFRKAAGFSLCMNCLWQVVFNVLGIANTLPEKCSWSLESEPTHVHEYFWMMLTLRYLLCAVCKITALIARSRCDIKLCHCRTTLVF